MLVLMFRTSLLIATLAAVTATIACGSSSTSSPTTPSDATVASVSLVAGAPLGAGFQFTARALMSDGTSVDVTSAAQWESLTPALATVDGTGFVTIVSPGDAEFRAVYRTVEARSRLAVVQTRYTISGRVSPVYPNSLKMNGVTVQITAGPNAGAFAVTDFDGGYSLTELTPGTIDLQATVNGFTTWRLTRLAVTTNLLIQPVMFPTPPVNEFGTRATGQCNDATWTYTADPVRACNAHGGLAWGVCPGPLCDALGSVRR